MTRTIGEQLGANNTETAANKVNTAYLIYMKIKCKINICRSSLIKSGKNGKNIMTLFKKQF